MKNIKIYIVTYRRPEVLNSTLDRLFNHTDFPSIPDTEVNIINNHSEFRLDEEFVNKVTVLHNNTRPDWDTGNLARNWNEALLHGFKSLANPDTKIVVTMQNDIVLDANWSHNLLKLHQKYTFVTGQLGDNIVSYRPEAVKKIGMWDERFITPANKEADYYIRALIFNKEKSMINDKVHGRLLNAHDALPLDTSEYRGDEQAWRDIKTNEISREGWYHTSQIFYWKWKNTWKTQPAYRGWLTKWSPDFISNPPNPPMVPNFVQYYYFEKDIELSNKNYVGWRSGDCWLDLGKCEDIDVHPFKEGEKFRND
ncbi:MAG TPA: glycosyltransferase family 2 protein [Flavobacteriales bacterium]|nr:glycosyltransferase family 2 protein [Flavobacteriales bacterium]